MCADEVQINIVKFMRNVNVCAKLLIVLALIILNYFKDAENVTKCANFLVFDFDIPLCNSLITTLEVTKCGLPDCRSVLLLCALWEKWCIMGNEENALWEWKSMHE